MQVRVTTAGEVIGAVRRIGSTSCAAALRVGVVGIEMATLVTAGATSAIEVIGGSVDSGCDGWCGTEAAVRTYAFAATFFVDKYYHPDAHCTGVAQ